MKKSLLILLAALLMAAFPVAAQDDDSDSECEIDTSGIIALLEDAQGLANGGDIESAVEVLEDAQNDLDALVASCASEDMAMGDNSAAAAEAQTLAALEALFTFESEIFAEFVCESERETVIDIFETAFADAGLTEDIIELIEIDLSEVEVSADVDGDEATVTISGDITLSAMGQEQTQPAASIFEELILVFEDGQWVICDIPLGDDDAGGDDMGGDDMGGGDVVAEVETRMSEALAAIFTFDAEAIAPYICEAQRDDLVTVLEDAVASAGLTQDILDALSVDVSDVTYDVEVDGDEATVDVGGTIVLSIFGTDQPQDAGSLFVEPAAMILEDGEWVICDPAIAGALGN